MNIHTPSGVEGSITLVGLADVAQHQINVTGFAANTFGWIDHTSAGYTVG
jgi:hypothetical protein